MLTMCWGFLLRLCMTTSSVRAWGSCSTRRMEKSPCACRDEKDDYKKKACRHVHKSQWWTALYMSDNVVSPWWHAWRGFLPIAAISRPPIPKPNHCTRTHVHWTTSPETYLRFYWACFVFILLMNLAIQGRKNLTHASVTYSNHQVVLN